MGSQLLLSQLLGSYLHHGTLLGSLSSDPIQTACSDVSTPISTCVNTSTLHYVYLSLQICETDLGKKRCFTLYQPVFGQPAGLISWRHPRRAEEVESPEIEDGLGVEAEGRAVQAAALEGLHPGEHGLDLRLSEVHLASSPRPGCGKL